MNRGGGGKKKKGKKKKRTKNENRRLKPRKLRNHDFTTPNDKNRSEQPDEPHNIFFHIISFLYLLLTLPVLPPIRTKALACSCARHHRTNDYDISPPINTIADDFVADSGAVLLIFFLFSFF
jgi:hypothetical protein